MSASTQAVTYLFSDIEGSTRLWEHEPDRMRPALAHHDAVSRHAVEGHRGSVVKMTGDGVHAAFDDPLDALAAVLEMQLALAQADPAADLALRIRCGLHLGIDERRRGDFFGPAVNRAARIMSAAHGGQILVSEAVARDLRDRLPPGVSLRDLGTVRLRDLSTPERVYQVVHPALRLEFPALRSLEATPNNLAQQLNRFIGRERELEAVRALLAKNRLVTLLGMGGLGKSRLSVQLAAEAIDDYPDGAWMVELAPLADPALVAQALASVLGVKEEAGRPVSEALVKFVRDRTLLIVLDNCEHVVQACAELARQILQASTQVKILASSRDALQIAGETVFQLAPLEAPGDVASETLAALERSDAVQLFVDRATAAQPAFRLTDQNAAAVASICRRLDGIPLALELAAARTRSLSAEAIEARLQDRFRLLVSGDRTALPRQRTLRALIDWSYDLLASAERELFQSLSVFAGGWTLEAAEAVGASATLPAIDVLDPLTRLVEKSLVIADIERNRYRMLETVRQYAKEKLEMSGLSAPANDRHLHFCLTLAEEARPNLAGPDQGAWLARLDLERENLHAAHAWCEQGGPRVDTDLRLVFALRPYWIHRGLFELGYRLTVEALDLPDADGHGLLRCQALHVAGQLCNFMGRHGDALKHLEESLAIAIEIGDRARIAAVQQPLGIARMGLGDVARARSHLQEAVGLAREMGNKRQLLAAVNELAQMHRAQGAPAEAEPHYRTVVALARELGDRQSIAIGLLNLAMVSIERGLSIPPRQILAEVLDIAQETGSIPAGQGALDVCAGWAALEGKWEHAARFFGGAEAQIDRTGMRRDPADQAFLSTLIVKARLALGEPAFAASESAGRALSWEQLLAEARSWLALDGS